MVSAAAVAGIMLLLAPYARFIPRAALAGPVCFGQNDSPLAQAMNMGILAMLIVVAGVLAAFAAFFIHLMRRAKMVARQSEGIAET